MTEGPQRAPIFRGVPVTPGTQPALLVFDNRLNDATPYAAIVFETVREIRQDAIQNPAGDFFGPANLHVAKSLNGYYL